VLLPAGEDRDRGEDAGVPVADELPGSRDADQQQRDQDVAEALRGAGAMWSRQQPQAGAEVEPERAQQQGD